MRTPFEILDTVVKPGLKARLGIPIARLFTGQSVEIPLVVHHGAHPGPTVWMSGVIHGDEIHGAEIIRRVLASTDPQTLRGTLLGVPVVNVTGFLSQSRYLHDRRDLNRSFPGSTRGSLASRMAHRFLNVIVKRCDLGIDLHAGSDHRTNVPQIRVDFNDARALELGRAFAAPVLVDSPMRSGSLRYAASQAGIPCLLYEASESLRIESEAVDAGVRGVQRILAYLDMVEDAPTPSVEPQVARASKWLRASHAGLLHLDVDLGQQVAPGAIVGCVRDIYGDVLGRLRSKDGGLVIGHTLKPLVHRGDAAVHLADVVGDTDS